ncbi:MAG: glycosyltransferase family 2 protein [Pseudomonadota bacterium]
MASAIEKLSLVIPCFNEEQAIPSVVPRTLRSLCALKEEGKISDFELIVVDDQSTDQSRELLLQYEDVQLVSLKKGPRGYGRALKEGFKKAQGDWVGFFDMDNSYRPEDLPLFVEEVGRKTNSFIMGQRGFNEKGMSFTRGMGNWVFMTLARVFYGSELEDVCSGYRLFHRKYLKSIIAIPEEGLDFSIYLTLAMINDDIPLSAIPIQYDERMGPSKLSVFADGWAFLKVVFKLKIRPFGAFKHSRV